MSAQVRARRGRWRTVSDDLGMTILWSVADDGTYHADWEVPLAAPSGTYRMLITANRYRLASAPFRVGPARLALTGARVAGGRVALRLAYPAAVAERDLTYRPAAASGGRVVARVGRRRVVARARRGPVLIAVPAGRSLRVSRRRSARPPRQRQRERLRPQGLASGT